MTAKREREREREKEREREGERERRGQFPNTTNTFIKQYKQTKSVTQKERESERERESKIKRERHREMDIKTIYLLTFIDIIISIVAIVCRIHGVPLRWGAGFLGFLDGVVVVLLCVTTSGTTRAAVQIRGEAMGGRHPCYSLGKYHILCISMFVVYSSCCEVMAEIETKVLKNIYIY